MYSNVIRALTFKPFPGHCALLRGGCTSSWIHASTVTCFFLITTFVKLWSNIIVPVERQLKPDTWQMANGKWVIQSHGARAQWPRVRWEMSTYVTWVSRVQLAFSFRSCILCSILETVSPFRLSWFLVSVVVAKVKSEKRGWFSRVAKCRVRTARITATPVFLTSF